MLKSHTAKLATANANLDGTGEIKDLIVAGPKGGRVVRRGYCAKVTTTLGWVSFYVDKGDGWELDGLMPVDARTLSGTTVPPSAASEPCCTDLQPFWKYGAAMGKAEATIASIEVEHHA